MSQGGNEIYYKIYKSKRLDNKLTIITLQWFDEYDYDEERFLKDRNGSDYEFDSENEAMQWMADHIKSSMIDPEYTLYNDNDYFK